MSTYADYEQDGSRVHEAAARAVRSLNDRAHEKYRSGDRTKSLLVVDEVHYLAPKNSAPEPELDEHVKRCRGQLIKVATEGGNKGISVVSGYQRRAFLHNGVIQLCDDYIAHKPGDEDVDRTADALRCSEDELANLQTGEILARGESITDGDLVGPTKVRKRRSPDPREESFELPETPDELSNVLEDIQEEVEAERERRTEREDELERLRDENERLREEKAELEEELANVDKISDAMERLVGSGNGGAGDGAAAEVGEGVQELQGRVDELKQERDRLQEELDNVQAERDELAEQNEALQERVADLEADVQELRSAFEGAREDVAALDELVFHDVNNGVYKAGFATSQGAYEEAYDALFARLDWLEERLTDRRFLCGDRLTLADVRLFTTLVRFDAVYHTHFMCNHKLIREYDNLWPYLRDLFQTGDAERSEGSPNERAESGGTRESLVAETVDLDHITEHYYTTHPDVSPKRIVPIGPDLDFEAPHDRDELPGEPPDALAALA